MGWAELRNWLLYPSLQQCEAARKERQICNHLQLHDTLNAITQTHSNKQSANNNLIISTAK